MRSIILSACVLLSGCATSVPVTQHGSMREVLRNGQTQPRVALATVTDRPGSIAVGALAGLGGEVTIVDGDVWVARSRDGHAEVTGPAAANEDRATLLTVAYVDEWARVPLPQGGGGAELAALIAEAAKSRGVDTSRPFPFVVEGQLTELEAHVIAGSCPHANPDGEPPWRYTLQAPAAGKLVGFYAEGMDGIMTHHGDTTHAHVVFELDGERIAAHADHAAVAPGATVRIPGGS